MGTQSLPSVYSLNGYSAGNDPAVFLLLLCKIDVEALGVELVMYHIFQIIPSTDVNDVYNVSSVAQDTQEFIIRRAQQGNTVDFSSPSHKAMVKARLHPLVSSAIHHAKATLLHVGMLSVDLNDEELRAACYELIGADALILTAVLPAKSACNSGASPHVILAHDLNYFERQADLQAAQVTRENDRRTSNQNMLSVPEIMHLVTLTAGAGPELVAVTELLLAMSVNRLDDVPASEVIQLHHSQGGHEEN
ncbi:hypothetical protein R3P38DRAFT_3214188 [Favolaschia claudopus]|uniref:Uncharacterized protein n=1 Tax=Favolaschia claudopus TaxID=2862362 RepID=A0AAW0AAH8_9AGAR